MPIQLRNLRWNLDEDFAALQNRAARNLGVGVGDVRAWQILRRSIDARKKNDIYFNCHVAVTLGGADEEKRCFARFSGNARDIAYPYREERFAIQPGKQPFAGRPVVVGAGPCGLFAAWLLAEAGFRPLLIERGKPIESRVQDVEAFWERGLLDPESNALFGEGGAGTFSDGKLTARGKDPFSSEVLRRFVQLGAPESIAYDAKAHIGSDSLRGIIAKMRGEITRLGGELRFEHKFTGWRLDKRGALCAVNAEHNGECLEIETRACLLAIGHSARDSYETLFHNGILMQAKAFAVGLRAEHPQKLIDEAQYGKYAGHPKLGAADYHLTAQSSDGRGVYSFCMCPGGRVVASAGEQGGVVTNGMSFAARADANANAALIVQVSPSDFGESALDGVAFQRRLEEAAFRAGGGGFVAPAQRMEDFLRRRPTVRFGGVQPSYKPGVRGANFWDILPRFCADGIAQAIPAFARQIVRYDLSDAVLTGVETRSSAPLRVLRGEDGQSPSCPGLYPAGEGAGYAGGIVSAAIDGLRAAARIAEQYAPAL